MKNYEDCPIGRFKINGKGSDYYVDNFCLECIFRSDSEKCACPEGLTQEGYKEFKIKYMSSVNVDDALSDEGFLRYLKTKYSSKTI